MFIYETAVVIALWLAFVWFCDPDGFRAARAAVARSQAATRHPSR
jgi:hypothetical protein